MKHTGNLTIKDTGQPGVFKDFVRLPYRLYHKNPQWVPPLFSEEKRTLDKKQNPFLKKNPAILYVCYKDKTPVGRIAGIINEAHNKIHKDNTAFFGFFESIPDDAVAGQLFQAVSHWVKDRGADTLRGPTNFSLNDVSGLLIEGFDEPPFILMPYNPPYYVELLRKNGFEIVMRYLAYYVAREAVKIPGFMEKLEKRLKNNGIIIRNIDFSNLERDSKMIVEIFNHSWNENWGFVPVSYEEALEDFRKVRVFAKTDLIFIAEHEGRPVGFALALPDIHQAIKPLNGRLLPFNWIKLLRNIKKIDQIRVLLMGVLKEYRSKGVDLMFYKKIVDSSFRYNFRRAELSWILEDNRMMNRVLEHINAKVGKSYAIFEKDISHR